jgi:hypothetical protein
MLERGLLSSALLMVTGLGLFILIFSSFFLSVLGLRRK